MFGFLIKKWFFDLWDNLLAVIIVNLGFLAIMAVPTLLPPAAARAGAPAGWIALLGGIALAFVYLGGVSFAAREWTSYRRVEMRAFFSALYRDIKTSIAIAAMTMAHVLLLSVALPFYSGLGNALGLFAVAVLFWISVAWFLSLQYLPATRSHFVQPLGQTLRKALLVMFDNLGFSIALFITAIIIALLSAVTVFLIPGPAGIAILYAAALKLRLLKYDYLEEHPEERKSIPWDALLYEERERVGKRTLRGMIFPWKE